MIIDFIISCLNYIIYVEENHPRKCYLLMGMILGIII
jgi:hypothetical protein